MTLDAADFALVAKLVRERSGIALEPGKEYLVEARLTALARDEGLGSLADVLQQVRARTTAPLAQRVVEAMTTNETLWFRDVRPFDALRTDVLPALLRARAATRCLVVWSAAASTGQEAYSIAILLREHFAELAGWDVQIVATDLSTDVLDRARAGRYTQLEVNRGLPAALLVKWFERDGVHWQVHDEVRRMVRFEQLNLAAPQWPAAPRADLVFLRNALMYFDMAARRETLARLRATIAPDGYLFLGAGEHIADVDPAWRRVDVGSSHCFRLNHGAGR